MLTTGTVACSASSSRRSSLPVRRPIAATWRESTSAVSRTDSPRVSCSSSGAQHHRVAAELERRRPRTTCACASTAARRAARPMRPASAREAAGAALSSSARSRIEASSAGASSRAGEEVARQGGQCTVGLRARAHLEPLPRPGRAAARAAACWPSSPRRSPAGSGTSRCCRRCRRGGRRRSRRACGAEHRVGAAPRATALLGGAPGDRRRATPTCSRPTAAARNAILVRGGGDRRAPRRTALALRPERRMAHGVALPSGGWVVNLHASTRRRGERRRAPSSPPAAGAALGWAGGAPLVVGGDFNLPGDARAAGAPPRRRPPRRPRLRADRAGGAGGRPTERASTAGPALSDRPRPWRVGAQAACRIARSRAA